MATTRSGAARPRPSTRPWLLAPFAVPFVAVVAASVATLGVASALTEDQLPYGVISIVASIAVAGGFTVFQSARRASYGRRTAVILVLLAGLSACVHGFAVFVEFGMSLDFTTMS